MEVPTPDFSQDISENPIEETPLKKILKYTSESSESVSNVFSNINSNLLAPFHYNSLLGKIVNLAIPYQEPVTLKIIGDNISLAGGLTSLGLELIQVPLKGITLLVKANDLITLNKLLNTIKNEIKLCENDVDSKEKLEELTNVKKILETQIKQIKPNLWESLLNFTLSNSSLAARTASTALTFAPAIRGVGIASGVLGGVISILEVVSQGLSLKNAVNNVIKVKKWIRNPKFKEKKHTRPPSTVEQLKTEKELLLKKMQSGKDLEETKKRIDEIDQALEIKSSAFDYEGKKQELAELANRLENKEVKLSKKEKRKILDEISGLNQILNIHEEIRPRLTPVEELLIKRKTLEKKRLETSKNEFNKLRESINEINKTNASDEDKFIQIIQKLANSGIYLEHLSSSFTQGQPDKSFLENLNLLENEIVIRKRLKQLMSQKEELTQEISNLYSKIDELKIKNEKKNRKKIIEIKEKINNIEINQLKKIDNELNETNPDKNENIKRLKKEDLLAVLWTVINDENFILLAKSEFARHQDSLTFSNLNALKTLAPKKISLEKRLLNFKLGVESFMFGVSVVSAAASIALTIASLSGFVPPVAIAIPGIISLIISGGAMLLGLLVYGIEKPNLLKLYLKGTELKLWFAKFPAILTTIRMHFAKKQIDKHLKLLEKYKKISNIRFEIDDNNKITNIYLDEISKEDQKRIFKLIKSDFSIKSKEFDNQKVEKKLEIIKKTFNKKLKKMKSDASLLEEKQNKIKAKMEKLEKEKIEAGAKDFSRKAKVGKHHSEFLENYIEKMTGKKEKVNVYDDIAEKLMQGNIVMGEEGAVSDPIIGFLKEQMGIDLTKILTNGEDAESKKESVKNIIINYFGMNTDATLNFINDQNSQMAENNA